MKRMLNAKVFLNQGSKRGLNMHKWETLDLWAMKSRRKIKMSESWIWNTSNECYGVR